MSKRLWPAAGRLSRGFYCRFPRWSNGLSRDFSFDTFGMFLLSAIPPGNAPFTRQGAWGNEADMRILAAAVAATMISAFAHAAEVEGHITSIDRDKLTITLDNGKSYKLPGEFDVDSLSEGMDILFAYDEIAGENLITDIAMSE
jgi:hypothetical protein